MLLQPGAQETGKETSEEAFTLPSCCVYFGRVLQESCPVTAKTTQSTNKADTETQDIVVVLPRDKKKTQSKVRSTVDHKNGSQDFPFLGICGRFGHHDSATLTQGWRTPIFIHTSGIFYRAALADSKKKLLPQGVLVGILRQVQLVEARVR